ncbi:MAG: hypothetical protein WCX73_05225 [Candidatus Pacearchaeota archaeon]
MFSDTLKSLSAPSVWESAINLGGLNQILWRYPLYLFYGFFSIFSFNLNISDKIFIFWPTIILIPWAGFLLIKKVTNSDMGAFFGAILFSFNTYIISSNSNGHIMLPLAFSFGTFSFIFFMKFFESDKMVDLIISALFMFVCTIYDLRAEYIWLFIFFAYGIFIFVLSKANKKVYKKILFFLILIVLLNLYWIFGFISSNFFGNNPVLDRNLFGNSFWTLKNSISLSHPFWSFFGPQWFIVHEVQVYFWVIVLFVFFAFLFKKQNKDIIFFGIIALIGIFLSKQVDSPFQNVYPWLYLNFPGFNAFREATKFYFLVVLGYSVLMGFIVKKIKDSKIKFTNLILLILLILLLLNGIPILFGTSNTLFVKKDIPYDYIILKQYLSSQNDSFKTLWIPTYSRWSFYTREIPMVSIADQVNYDWAVYINENQDKDTKTKIQELVSLSNFNDLLDESSVKYIIIPLEDIKNNDNFFKDYNGNQTAYNDIIKNKNLSLVNIGNENIIIYENKNYKPIIYSNHSNIKFKKISESNYVINITDLSQVDTLHFSEIYNDGWVLKSKSGDILPHQKSLYGLNNYILNPLDIKDNYSKDYYTENPDGSINVELIMYFKPQSYFYLGLIISGTTLLACIGYLVYDWRKRKTLTKGEVS